MRASGCGAPGGSVPGTPAVATHRLGPSTGGRGRSPVQRHAGSRRPSSSARCARAGGSYSRASATIPAASRALSPNRQRSHLSSGPSPSRRGTPTRRTRCGVGEAIEQCARLGDLHPVRHGPVPYLRVGRHRHGRPRVRERPGHAGNGAGLAVRPGPDHRTLAPRGLQAVVIAGLSALRGCVGQVRFSTPVRRSPTPPRLADPGRWHSGDAPYRAAAPTAPATGRIPRLPSRSQPCRT